MNNLVCCPICGKTMKQINTAHLRSSHNIDIKDFKLMFPEYQTMTAETRQKKNHFKNLSAQMSQKLKFSHTLSGYIKRYGEQNGTKRYYQSKTNKSRSHTQQWYKQHYGETYVEVMQDHKKSKGVTLQKYITKYGEQDGIKKYNLWKSKQKYYRSVQYYIDKYGQEQGLQKWLLKNNKNSQSSRKIDICNIDLYKQYSAQVDRETNLNISLYGLEGLCLRSRNAGYSLDHKISKCYGFNNGISPKIIGNIHNLQIIPIKDNCSKGANCSIQLNQLLNKIKKEK